MSIYNRFEFIMGIFALFGSLLGIYMIIISDNILHQVGLSLISLLGLFFTLNLFDEAFLWGIFD